MTPTIETALLCIPLLAPFALLVAMAWGFADIAAYERHPADIIMHYAVAAILMSGALVVLFIIGHALVTGHFFWMRGGNTNKFPITL